LCPFMPRPSAPPPIAIAAGSASTSVPPDPASTSFHPSPFQPRCLPRHPLPRTSLATTLDALAPLSASFPFHLN
jgi:hypothetical protein